MFLNLRFADSEGSLAVSAETGDLSGPLSWFSEALSQVGQTLGLPRCSVSERPIGSPQHLQIAVILLIPSKMRLSHVYTF
jgi:hypothetical protein